MNKLNLSRTFHKVGLTFKKHSPEILVIAGVIGTVTSTVMACRATTKLSEITEKSQKELDAIHHAMEHPETLPEEYTAMDAKKDLTIVYTKTAMQVAKLYAPAAILGALSITSILASNNILRKRNVALAAAYTAVDKGFKEYRGRVVERFGKDIDRELRYNIKAKEVEGTVIDEKTGEEKTVTTTVNVVNPNDVSDFARIWYEGCPGHTKNPEKNLFYLKKQQDFANQKLQQEGYLFLNEVYEMLGFAKTAAGQQVGWVLGNGDGFVDFGIYNLNSEPNIRFVNGDERSILLDFNVDGYILDLI